MKLLSKLTKKRRLRRLQRDIDNFVEGYRRGRDDAKGGK